MSYLDDVLADSPLALWPLQSLVPPTFPIPNFALIDVANARNGTLFPAGTQSDGFLTQGLPGPILTDSPSYGTSGKPLAFVPNPGSPDPVLDLRGAQTWECWAIKGNLSGGTSGGSGTETAFNRGGDASTSYLSYGQRSTGNFADNAYWVMSWNSDTIGRNLISCPLVDGWHHLVVTYDGIDTMEMYVDSWLVARDDTCPPAPTFVQQISWRLGYMSNFAFGAVNISPGLAWMALYDYVLPLDRIISHNVTALGVRAANPCGLTPLEVSCPAETGEVGAVYSSFLDTFGGTPPYTYEIISGALPDGLTLNPTTGEIAGVPTVAGPFTFEARVTDADLNTAETPGGGCEIVIDETPPVPQPPIGPAIETCPENEPANAEELLRVQRVLDFTQAIHRNVQLQITSFAPLTLYGYSMEWVPVSVSELTEQRNAYVASWQFAEYGHLFYAYVAHISTEDLELEVIVDVGTGATSTDLYTIPNTGGTFRKDWVILRARKGKLFDITFRCDEEFQIIPAQSVLFGKEFKEGSYRQTHVLWGPDIILAIWSHLQVASARGVEQDSQFATRFQSYPSFWSTAHRRRGNSTTTIHYY